MNKEEIVKIIQEAIIEDNQVVAESPEYKFARQLTNQRLKEIIEKINNL